MKKNTIDKVTPRVIFCAWCKGVFMDINDKQVELPSTLYALGQTHGICKPCFAKEKKGGGL